MDLVLVGILAAVLAAAVGAWRLSQGPVSLAFAKPYFDQALGELGTRYRITVGDIVLAWGGWRRPLDVLAVDTALRDAAGNRLAGVPEVSISLDLAALASGRIAPTRLELIGASFAARRDADGTVTVGLSGADGSPVPIDVETVLDRSGGGPPAESLRLIVVRDTRLRVDDRRLGVAVEAPAADLVVTRGAAAAEAAFKLDIRAGDASAKVSGVARRSAAGGAVDLTAELGGVVPADWARALGGAVPALDHLKAVTTPLAGNVRVRLDDAGAIEEARVDLTGGAGAASHPALGGHRFDVASVKASGSFDPARGRIVVDRLDLDLGGPRLSLTGAVELAGAEARATAQIRLRGMTMAALPRYWPEGVAAGARAWVTRNLDEGRVEGLEAQVAVGFPEAGTAPRIERAETTLRLADARVHYLRPLDPFTGVDAAVRIGVDTVEIAVERGSLRGLAVDGGTVAITNLGDDRPALAVEVALHGPVADALGVLDHPDFRYAAKLGVDPARVSGTARVTVGAHFPVIAALGFEDVAFDAGGTLQDVAAPGGALGRDVTGGMLSLRIDARGMNVSGKARIDGLAADIDWSERFDDAGPFRRRYDVRGRLAQIDRARLGLDLAPLVTGPVSVAASYQLGVDGARAASGTVDLAEAGVRIAGIGWRKPPGVAGQAAFALDFRDGAVRAVRLSRLAAGDLRFAGRIALAETGGTVETVEVDRLAIGDRYDLSGGATRDGEGGWSVSVSGPAFDAAPLIEGRDRGAEILPPLQVDADIDRLALTHGESLRGARLSFRYDGRAWRRIEAQGRFGNGGPATLDYRADDAERRLVLAAGDAGAFFRMVGVTDRVRGGRLTLEARQKPDRTPEPWTGDLLVKGFVLAGTPKLARALRVASFGTLSKTLDGKGVYFHRLELPMTYAPPLVTIKRGKALGRELGLTGDGVVDVKAETIDLKGTLIPAYTLNSALGSLPGLGRLFSGVEGGGLFAAAFGVKGPLDDPNVRFNPLAALAPGFLRSLIVGTGDLEEQGGASDFDFDPERSLFD